MVNQATTIKVLYPELSEVQLKQAEENLTLYLALMLRIHARLEKERDSLTLADGHRP